MTHGVEAYFIERWRARRRVAIISASLALIFLLVLGVQALPTLRHPVRDLLDETTRFGYEGPDQFVRRISLQQVRGSHQVTQVGSIETRRGRSGGAKRTRTVRDRRAVPEVQSDHTGQESTDFDMLQRAVSRLADIPVVQSEDLVIEYASKPLYPEAEVEKGIEGRVMVQALIDTTGRVVDVQLLASTGVAPFERSAAEAVWQYRFRPYRPGGVTREVYAIFRFAFRIY